MNINLINKFNWIYKFNIETCIAETNLIQILHGNLMMMKHWKERTMNNLGSNIIISHCPNKLST